MRSMRVEKVLVGAAIVAAMSASGRVASAHGDVEKEKDKRESTAPAAGGASIGGSATLSTAGTSEMHGEGEAKKEGGGSEYGHGEEEEGPLKLGIDFVLGFGKTSVVDQDLPGTLATTPTTELHTAQMTTYSFVLGASYELNRHFAIGARLPFETGSISSPGESTRGSSVFGNIELEGEYEAELTEKLGLSLGLGVALPTAQGTEVPSAAEVEELNANHDIINQNGYDRFAIGKAASNSRGWEDTALFEPKHLAFIPSATLEWKPIPRLHVVPWVKLEALISTVSVPEQSFVAELVPGVSTHYELIKHLEPGFRLWMNAPLTDASFKTVAVVEPQIRFPFTGITPVVGVLVPFAGTQQQLTYAGVRLAVAGRF